MRNVFFSVVLAIVITGSVGMSLASASKANDTLVVAWPKEVPNIDAYFNNVREGVVVGDFFIWDTLVYRDPDTGKIAPLLAISWKYENPTTIDFDLRQDVKFHNGQPFTADDVVYTLNWVIDPKNKVVVPDHVNWIAKAEKLGKYKVRIVTKRPFPAALETLSNAIPIYPHEYYSKVGPKGMGMHPIGTGPYKVAELVPGKEIVLVKNTDYFGNSPKGKPHIGKIVMRVIPEMSTEIADLISGRVDWLWQVPTDQAEKLKRFPNVTVKTAGSFRFGYLTMDAAGRTGTENNPFTKLKVRQAISYAIDRKAIVSSLIKGASKVVDAVCSPMQDGCTQDVVKYRYDPTKAKKLLAEAGYPNGFTTTFYAYRDPAYAQAIAGYLNAVGIKTKFQQFQFSTLRDKVRSGEIPFAFMTWGSRSIADISASTSVFFEGEPDDMARDQQVETWLKEADTTLDGGKRNALYKRALERIAQQAYWLPLFTYSINYAFSKDLDWTPTNDEVFRLFQAKWK